MLISFVGGTTKTGIRYFTGKKDGRKSRISLGYLQSQLKGYPEAITHQWMSNCSWIVHRKMNGLYGDIPRIFQNKKDTFICFFEVSHGYPWNENVLRGICSFSKLTKKIRHYHYFFFLREQDF